MKGGAGQTCNDVCGALAKTCNSEKQSTLTTNELVSNAFLEAGYSCKSFRGHRDYAGTPYSTGRLADDCSPITPGAKSICTGNKYTNHYALCYCEEGKRH